MTKKEWETLHKWQWFRLNAWQHTFREDLLGGFGGSPAAFKQVLESIGGRLALDSSCGLGLKTIIMHEIGIDVVGSDQSEFAIEKARELSRFEGHHIEFFPARWRELPSKTKLQFDAIFNDALSWVVTREDLEFALRGFLGALKPKGVLVFVGAPEGTTVHESMEKLDREWESKPRFSIEWQHTEDDITCTSLLARERREDFIDEHHLFLIEGPEGQRLETATIREPVYWQWGLLKEMILQAGFSRVETREFLGMGKGGSNFTLNIATK